MHENFQFAATIITILVGILFARNDVKELRADFRRMEDRLDSRTDKVENRLNSIESEVKNQRIALDAEMKALRKDYTEFYAEQRRHDEAIETLKKK